MNKHIKNILLIPVDIALFWEILFFFWWWVLIGMDYTTEFQTNGQVEWNFLILITAMLATLMTPGLTIIETKIISWLEYRVEQIYMGKRKPNRLLQWLGQILNIDKKVEQYIEKRDKGDRWYESR